MWTDSIVIKKSAIEEAGIQYSFIILLNHGCHILYVNKNKYKIWRERQIFLSWLDFSIPSNPRSEEWCKNIDFF